MRASATCGTCGYDHYKTPSVPIRLSASDPYPSQSGASCRITVQQLTSKSSHVLFSLFGSAEQVEVQYVTGQRATLMFAFTPLSPVHLSPSLSRSHSSPIQSRVALILISHRFSPSPNDTPSAIANRFPLSSIFPSSHHIGLLCCVPAGWWQWWGSGRRLIR